MQAVVYPRANEMELSAVAEPAPGPGQALVKVRATTICATDFKVFAGHFPGTRFPHIPGHEWSGNVVAVGPDVDEVAPGDRVGVEVHVGCRPARLWPSSGQAPSGCARRRSRARWAPASSSRWAHGRSGCASRMG